MPPFLYSPPATSLLSYSDICLDPSSSYAVVLSDATEARARLRDALKQAQGNDADWLAVLDAAQGYLRHVFGLQDLLDADKVLQKGELAFPWKSAFSRDQIGSSSSFRSLPTFASELLFALYTYAIGLCNQACLVMQTLPSTSSQGSSKKTTQPLVLTNEEEKRKVDKLALAADYLCRAAGVYSYIAGEVLPLWESLVRSCPAASPSHFGGKGKNKMPVECARETANGLAALAMADAHALAIQKLLSSFPTGGAGVPVSLPLPKGHPSPGLLAKLNLHVASLYTSSRNLLKTVGTASGDDVAQVDDSIAPDLLNYTKKEAALASTRARKWLGVEAGEKGEVGVALAWLKDALDRTETSTADGLKSKMGRLKLGSHGSSSGGGGNKSSGAEERKDRLSRTAAERKEIERFMDVYKHLNGTVSFQPVPSASSLASSMPSGRPILTPKSFARSAFGGAAAAAQTSRTADYF